MNQFTIQQLQQMRESEDRVEFKAGEGDNVSYDGRGKTNPTDYSSQHKMAISFQRGIMRLSRMSELSRTTVRMTR